MKTVVEMLLEAEHEIQLQLHHIHVALDAIGKQYQESPVHVDDIQSVDSVADKEAVAAAEKDWEPVAAQIVAARRGRPPKKRVQKD